MLDEESIFDDLSILPQCLKDLYLNQRSSCDTRHVNDYGRQLLDLCIASNHLILNGRMPGDKHGNFTRIEKDSKGVLDYAISKANFIPTIKDLEVCNLSPDSDHCGILATLFTKFSPTSICNRIPVPCIRYHFDPDQSVQLQQTLSHLLDQLSTDIYTDMSDNISTASAADQFQSILISCAEKCCKKSTRHKLYFTKNIITAAN